MGGGGWEGMGGAGRGWGQGLGGRGWGVGIKGWGPEGGGGLGGVVGY